MSMGPTFIHASSVTKSCPTLCNPMDCSPPGSSVHGILQARILEWVPIFFSRGPSQPKDPTYISYTGRRVLYHWVTREALSTFITTSHIRNLDWETTCKNSPKLLRAPAKGSEKDYCKDGSKYQDTRNLRKPAFTEGEFKIKSYKHSRKQTTVIKD